MRTRKGAGLLNSAIDKLPFELHLPGYSYCGPGTKLQKRLLRGDLPINKLDSYCKDHDTEYSKYKDLESRHKADQVLENKAWERVKDPDSSFSEKRDAWIVTTAMKTKRKLGMGLRRKEVKKTTPLTKSFKTHIVNKVTKHVKKCAQDSSSSSSSPLKDSIGAASKMALKAAKMNIKRLGGRKNIKVPRVIKVPKTGGFLPLIPIFAGLSALGALSGGAAGIVKAVKDTEYAKKNLKESKRHNEAMEKIASSKNGEGLFLQKQKTGYGLYLQKMSKNYQ